MNVCDLGRQFFPFFFFLVFLRLRMNHKNDTNHMFFFSVCRFVRIRILVVVVGRGAGSGASSSVTQHIHTHLDGLLFFAFTRNEYGSNWCFCSFPFYWHLRKSQSPQVFVTADQIIADQFNKMNRNMKNNKLLCLFETCEIRNSLKDSFFHNTFSFVCGSDGTLASICIFGYFYFFRKDLQQLYSYPCSRRHLFLHHLLSPHGVTSVQASACTQILLVNFPLIHLQHEVTRIHMKKSF